MEHRKKMIRIIRQKRNKALDVIAILTLFLLYSVFMFIMTGGVCMFKGIFGLPCPGCGGTRAMILLAKGDIHGSMELNPSAPLLFLCLFNELRVNCFRKGSKKIAGLFLMISVIVSIIIYIMRMRMYFPDREPYVFNSECLLLRFLRILHM